jgi:FkbM family methyltransferase
MKKIIDLGCHKLEGLLNLYNSGKIDSDFKVYCFEPNPFIFEKTLNEVKIHKNKFVDIILFNFAVGDEDKTLFMNIDETQNSQACNTLPNPPEKDIVYNCRWNWVKKIEVKSISSKTLFELCEIKENDYLIIKCDIEGSEFVFLDNLLKNPLIKTLREVYIEWHERFWYPNHGQKIIEKNYLINSLNNLNIKVNTWY